MNTSLRIKLIF